MKLSSNYELRKMAGEFVLMPQGERLLKGKKPLIVNEVTADLLIGIAEGKSLDVIKKWFVAEYGIDYETADNELDKTVEKLKDLGAVI